MLRDFAKVNLHPNAVDSTRMGTIFEELIRRFAEASNETAGEHFTPREVVRLIVSLLFAEQPGKDPGSHGTHVGERCPRLCPWGPLADQLRTHGGHLPATISSRVGAGAAR